MWAARRHRPGPLRPLGTAFTLVIVLQVLCYADGELPGYVGDALEVRAALDDGQGSLEAHLGSLWCKYGLARCGNATAPSAPSRGGVAAPPVGPQAISSQPPGAAGLAAAEVHQHAHQSRDISAAVRLASTGGRPAPLPVQSGSIKPNAAKDSVAQYAISPAVAGMGSDAPPTPAHPPWQQPHLDPVEVVSAALAAVGNDSNQPIVAAAFEAQAGDTGQEAMEHRKHVGELLLSGNPALEVIIGGRMGAAEVEEEPAGLLSVAASKSHKDQLGETGQSATAQQASHGFGGADSSTALPALGEAAQAAAGLSPQLSGQAAPTGDQQHLGMPPIPTWVFGVIGSAAAVVMGIYAAHCAFQAWAWRALKRGKSQRAGIATAVGAEQGTKLHDVEAGALHQAASSAQTSLAEEAAGLPPAGQPRWQSQHGQAAEQQEGRSGSCGQLSGWQLQGVPSPQPSVALSVGAPSSTFGQAVVGHEPAATDSEPALELNASPAAAFAEADASVRNSDVHQMGWSPNPYLDCPHSSYTNPFFAFSGDEEATCPPPHWGALPVAANGPGLAPSASQAVDSAACSLRAATSPAPPAVDPWDAALGNACEGGGSSAGSSPIRAYHSTGGGDGESSGGSSPIEALHESLGGQACSKQLGGPMAGVDGEEAGSPAFKLGTALESPAAGGQHPAAGAPSALPQEERVSCLQADMLPKACPGHELGGAEGLGPAEASGSGSHALLAAESVGPQAVAEWEREADAAAMGGQGLCSPAAAGGDALAAGSSWEGDEGGEVQLLVRLVDPSPGADLQAGAQVLWQHTFTAPSAEHGPPSYFPTPCEAQQAQQEQEEQASPCAGTAALGSTSPALHGWAAPAAGSPRQPFAPPLRPSSGGRDPDALLCGVIVSLTAEQFEAEVQFGALLGVGGAGSVYRGTWRGQQVAVKVIHPSHQVHPSSVAAFKREVQLLGRLGAHPRVVRVLAACLAPPHCCIVQELAERGSLWKLLHEDGLRPQYGALLQLAEDIASAMHYSHQLAPPVVHRDLKSHNILLGADGRARVCDWGLARSKNRTFLTNEHQGALGTVAYMAPEVFSAGNVDERADVYAFGVIVWECLTGRQPWAAECSNVMQIIMAVGVERRRLPIPADCPPPLRKLIKECWRQHAALRPSFGEVLQRLQELRTGRPLQPGASASAEQPSSATPAASKQVPARVGGQGRPAKYSPALAGAGAALPSKDAAHGAGKRVAARQEQAAASRAAAKKSREVNSPAIGPRWVL